jgi:hypothetical protein
MQEGKFLWLVSECYWDQERPPIAILETEEDAIEFIAAHKDKDYLVHEAVPFYTQFTGVCKK